MITVYVREIEELEGHFLGDFMPSDIADVVRLLKEYPTYTDDDSVFVTAQFVANGNTYGGAAVFEIVVGDEDEA